MFFVLRGRNAVPALGRRTGGVAGSGVWTASSARQEGSGSVLKIDNRGGPGRGADCRRQQVRRRRSGLVGQSLGHMRQLRLLLLGWVGHWQSQRHKNQR